MTASFTCCIPEREGTGQELGKPAIMACSHHDGMCRAPYQPAIPAAYWSEESLHRAAHWAMLRRLGWSAGCCSVLPSCSKISPSGAKVLPAANRVQFWPPWHVAYTAQPLLSMQGGIGRQLQLQVKHPALITGNTWH